MPPAPNLPSLLFIATLPSHWATQTLGLGLNFTHTLTAHLQCSIDNSMHLSCLHHPLVVASPSPTGVCPPPFRLLTPTCPPYMCFLPLEEDRTSGWHFLLLAVALVAALVVGLTLLLLTRTVVTTRSACIPELRGSCFTARHAQAGGGDLAHPNWCSGVGPVPGQCGLLLGIPGLAGPGPLAALAAGGGDHDPAGPGDQWHQRGHYSASLPTMSTTPW